MPMTTTPHLHLRGVSVRYPGADAPALRDLSLEIGAGERVAIIGPSGAGKSTILRLAAGLALPDSGTVEVFGVDSRSLGARSNRATRSRIGIITQDFALVGPLRVASNVAAGRLGQWRWWQALRTLVRPRDIDAIAAVLDRVGIAEKIWDRSDRLSGGQQQRTAIARALYQSPDLFLADEPVSALDPARSDAVMAVLAAEVSESTSGPGRALVASMHDAPLAMRHCDRLVAVRDGAIEFDLPAADITNEQLEDLYSLERP